MRLNLCVLWLVSSLAACQATSTSVPESDSFASWSKAQAKAYGDWRASQPDTRQRTADDLVHDLTRFLFYLPPGHEKRPRQSIEGWRERYLATVRDLGTRLTAFGDSAQIVALAPFGMSEPDPPPDEPYHRYRRGSPSINGYLRL